MQYALLLPRVRHALCSLANNISTNRRCWSSFARACNSRRFALMMHVSRCVSFVALQHEYVVASRCLGVVVRKSVHGCVCTRWFDEFVYASTLVWRCSVRSQSAAFTARVYLSCLVKRVLYMSAVQFLSGWRPFCTTPKVALRT